MSGDSEKTTKNYRDRRVTGPEWNPRPPKYTFCTTAVYCLLQHGFSSRPRRTFEDCVCVCVCVCGLWTKCPNRPSHTSLSTTPLHPKHTHTHTQLHTKANNEYTMEK